MAHFPFLLIIGFSCWYHIPVDTCVVCSKPCCHTHTALRTPSPLPVTRVLWMCAAAQQVKQVNPCNMVDDGQKQKRGGGRGAACRSPKPAKASTTWLQIVAQPLDGWRGALCLLPPPGTPSWPLRNMSCWDMAALRQASWTVGLISKTASSTSGPESMVLSGCPAQTKPPYTVAHTGNVLGKTGLVLPQAKANSSVRLVLLKDTGIMVGNTKGPVVYLIKAFNSVQGKWW